MRSRYACHVTTGSRVRQYIGYFRGELAQVQALRCGPEIPEDPGYWELRLALHQKTLCCAMLESLAGHRYPRDTQSSRRFKRLLREHAKWSTSELVSVPILAANLAGSSSALAAHCRVMLARHSTEAGDSLPVTAFDVPSADLESLAASKEERKLIARCRHVELLYAYRCYLAHEFREPGYAMDVMAGSEAEPRYHGYANEEGVWVLLYPVGFFRALVESCLDSLEEHHMQTATDPYDSVEDSSPWIVRRR